MTHPLPQDHQVRIARARLSLDGLSTGDAFGEKFFAGDARHRIAERQLPEGPWRYTDDTVMAISIVENLAEHGEIEPDSLSQALARRFVEEPWRGYGGGAQRLLAAVADGTPWQSVAPRLFGGQGSFGNGAAMRVAPVGGYFAGEPERAAEAARRSAVVTHAHPEGRAGAIAVAVAAAVAAGDGPAERMLSIVVQHTPRSTTRQGLEEASRLGAVPSTRAAQLLGSGSRISAQDTVPFVVWAASHHLDDYEEALWSTVAGLGDRDTTCAMVGGIVALRVGAGGLPEEWLRRREGLPE